MASVPTPRSYAQILGEMLETFASRQNIDGIKPGSPLLGVFESAAQSDARNAQDIFSVLNSMDIDRVGGAVLDRLGEGEGVPRQGQTYASGVVTVGDSSFTKVYGSIWDGIPAPQAGSTTVSVVTATWPTTGSLYLGRGTTSVEGPIPFSAAVESTPGVWTVALSIATTKFHYVGDEVVLAQGGDRAVPSGTVFANVPLSGSEATNFATTDAVTLFDGEDTVMNVPVRCQTAGSAGNVGVGAISSTPIPPFTGCTVTNPTALSNALDTENDIQYRNRIKVARRSKSKGTIDAIQSAIFGKSATDEAATVLSSSIVRRLGLPDILYIDDGTGYEPKSAGVGYESVLPAGSPSIERFKLINSPIAKASVTTTLAAPFAVPVGAALTVAVDGVQSTHIFDVTQFSNPTEASAYEVASSINANATLGFIARTSGSGRYVTIEARAETASVQVIDGGANLALGFPIHRSEDLFLYRNDRAFTGWVMDRNVAQVDLGAVTAGSITAGSSFTNGFLSEAAQTQYKIMVDGSPSIPYVSPAGVSVIWTFYLNENFAMVEVGANTSAFIDCRPGDILVFDTDNTVGPAATFSKNYSPHITYVAPNGSFVIVECPQQLGPLGPNYTTPNTQITVFRSAAGLVQTATIGDPDLDSATASLFGATVYDRDLEHRLSTNSSGGDIAGVQYNSTGKTPQAYPSTQPHFGYVTSKSAHSPEFNYWFQVKTNPSLTQLTVDGGDDVIGGSTNTAFGLLVGRPIPLNRFEATFSAAVRQGMSAKRLLEVISYSGAGKSTLNYRNEVGNNPNVDGLSPEGVFVDAENTTNPSYGSTLGSMHYFRFAPQDIVSVALDGRLPGLNIPLYIACTPTTAYGTTIALKANSTNLGLQSVFGNEFDFGGFALHQTPKAILSVLDGGGVIPAIGSAIAYGPLSTGVNASVALHGPDETFTSSVTVNTESGRYKVRFNLAADAPIAPAVPGDESYKVAITSVNANACQMTFQYAWNVTSAQRTTNVTTVTFTAGTFTASNLFAPGDAVYITLNDGSFVDSGSPHTITAVGGASPNWTLSFADAGVDTGAIAIANGWAATSLILPAATPHNFNELDTNPATGLDWIRVILPATYTPFQMNDTYPIYAKGNGYFALLVEKVTYPVAQFNTLTNPGVWGTWFQAFSSTTTWTDLATLSGANFGLLPTSIAGFTAVKIPYDTRHEYLLGYRAAIDVTLADEINFVGHSTFAAGYSLVLKNAVEPALSGYYGFNTQTVYLTPTTPKNVVDFLRAVSPLNIDRTVDGRISIRSDIVGASSAVEVVGGFANSTRRDLTPHPSIRTQFYLQDSEGFLGNSWVKFNSQTPKAKQIFTSTGEIEVVGGLVTATRDGAVGACSYAGTMTGPIKGERWYVEPQGEFTQFIWADIPPFPTHFNGFENIQGGDWVTIDPGAGQWALTRKASSVPNNPITVTLPGGKVARFGGTSTASTVLNHWSLYDPTTDTWNDSVTGTLTPMPAARWLHTATVLSDGKVLIAGGLSGLGFATAVDTLWVLDPSGVGTWTTVTATLPQKLHNHSATLMDDGSVIIAAGRNDSNLLSKDWYVFNYDSGTPANSTVTVPPRTLNLSTERHSAIKVAPDKLVICSGFRVESELLDTTAQSATLLGSTALATEAGTLIPNSAKILLFGDGLLTHVKSYLLDWVTGLVTSAADMPTSINLAKGIILNDKVYAFGTPSGIPTPSLSGAVYDPVANTWTRLASRLTSDNYEQGANQVVLMADGRFLSGAATPEIFTPTGVVSPISGTYQVAKVVKDLGDLKLAFWVEKVFDRDDLAIASIEFRRYDSIMPGDVINVASNVLGASNQRQFTVATVLGNNQFTTTPSMNDVGLTVLGTDYLNVQITPSTSNTVVRRLQWVGPESVTADRYIARMIPDTGATYSNENNVGTGWTVESLGKLGFSTTPSYGIDSYRYHTGLVKEVNRIVYGDPSDPALHPGVIAAGSSLNIEGPQVKRVKIALQVRTDQGVDVISGVQSAVTKAVNETPVGVSVAKSDIISAANGVPGVQSVALLSPTFTAGTDLITVQSFEKALVLNSSDVSVIITGV